jgi:hypothetical protein
MTNPLLQAENDIAIEEIHANLNTLETCLKLEQPRSLLLAAYYDHQKDVRRTFKDGL